MHGETGQLAEQREPKSGEKKSDGADGERQDQCHDRETAEMFVNIPQIKISTLYRVEHIYMVHEFAPHPSPPTQWRVVPISPVPASPCRVPPALSDTCVLPSADAWHGSTGYIPTGFPAPD